MTKPLTEEEMDKLVADLPIWTYKRIKCNICGHTHISVHIKDIEKVECPNCHFMTQT